MDVGTMGLTKIKDLLWEIASLIYERSTPPTASLGAPDSDPLAAAELALDEAGTLLVLLAEIPEEADGDEYQRINESLDIALENLKQVEDRRSFAEIERMLGTVAEPMPGPA